MTTGCSKKVTSIGNRMYSSAIWEIIAQGKAERNLYMANAIIPDEP